MEPVIVDDYHLSEIRTTLNLIDGYSEVEHELKSVLKLITNEEEIPVTSRMVLSTVFNKFARDMNLCKQVIGTLAYEALGDSITALRKITDVPGKFLSGIPDLKTWLEGDLQIIQAEIFSYVSNLKKLTDNLYFEKVEEFKV